MITADLSRTGSGVCQICSIQVRLILLRVKYSPSTPTVLATCLELPSPDLPNRGVVPARSIAICFHNSLNWVGTLQGLPFRTGLANQVTPEFQLIAAFEGDFFFNGLRRLFVQYASTTKNTWSWLSKRGKSTLELEAYHSSDIPLFFPTNTTVPTDNVTVDALSPSMHRFNASVFWPKRQTPSAQGSSSLLTFSDPGVVNIKADNFRAEPIQFLLDLHAEGLSLVGL
ncbi:hypothetical protein C8R44DRAFT_736827 [Mycena epipterygia]|nr:hypothetical protein C8R44DRAFT_736827 [Mycena epipterygia]